MGLKEIKQIIFFIFLFYLLSSCKKSPGYDLFLYPNKYDLTESQNGGFFKNKDEARDVALSWIADHPDGDYEIGEKSGRLSCSETGYKETFK